MSKHDYLHDLTSETDFSMALLDYAEASKATRDTAMEALLEIAEWLGCPDLDALRDQAQKWADETDTD